MRRNTGRQGRCRDTERSAVDKPGFSRFFRPADPYLNGECSDDDGYYIRQEFLVPVQ